MSHKNTSKLSIGPDFGILPLEIFFVWTEKWTEKFIFEFVNWTKFFFKRVNFELNLVHFLGRWTRTELSSHFWRTVTSLNLSDFSFLTVKLWLAKSLLRIMNYIFRYWAKVGLLLYYTNLSCWDSADYRFNNFKAHFSIFQII